MKTYGAEVLKAWPDDSQRLPASANPAYQQVFPGLRSTATSGLAWIAETVKATRGEDDSVFDSLYRRGHTIYGMAAMLGLPKLTHVLEIMDFALDLGRDLQTFERHSLGYLIALLTAAAQAIFDDLADRGSSDRDISDVTDECHTYLAEPLRLSLASKPLARPSPAPPIANPVSPKPPPVPVATNPFVEQIEDGPEELDIPTDKVGLISDFCEECRDSLSQIGRLMVELEGNAEPVALVNELFRSVHTVKGGARLLKVGKMEALSHRMESLLDQVRKGSRQVSSKLVDLLLDGNRLLEAMVEEVAARGPLRTHVGPTITALLALENGEVLDASPPVPLPNLPESGPAVPGELPVAPVVAAATVANAGVPGRAGAPRQASSDSIRVPTEKLDDMLNTASEVFISRIRLASDVAAVASAIRQFGQSLQQMNGFSLPSVLGRMAEANRRLVAELEVLASRRRGPLSSERVVAAVSRFHLELSAEADEHGIATPEELTLNLLSIDEVRKRLEKNVEHLEQLSGRLQTGAMGFRMVPIASLFDRFPTQVRELARQLGKKVHLEVSGGNTELDKVMINQLADPLMHIVRNSLDHGLEDGPTRLAAGKPELGQMVLRAYYHGSNAVIEVRDDGRGIDADRVLAKAVESGLVDAERAGGMTRSEIYQLIFAPGLSTAASVSTLSGRGVGMDVVMTAIGQVQGSILVDSNPGQGTTIRMRLPLTLAVVGVLLVRERDHMFAVPIQHVDEILTVSLAELHQVGDATLYGHRGTTIAVMTLSGLLDFPSSTFTGRDTSMIIMVEGERRVGLLVDAVLGRQEVLIKSLGRLLKKAPLVMGCTILSDSRLVLILNGWEAVNTQVHRAVALAPVTGREALRRRHALLIVDDSSTQRSYLDALLTQAGYMVDAAENGVDALKQLRSRRYTACCVDVVMPLMDGFELVERMRRLSDYRDTPVILITGQDSAGGAAEAGRARQLGISMVLRKPVDPAILLDQLDRACLDVLDDVTVEKLQASSDTRALMAPV